MEFVMPEKFVELAIMIAAPAAPLGPILVGALVQLKVNKQEQYHRTLLVVVLEGVQ